MNGMRRRDNSRTVPASRAVSVETSGTVIAPRSSMLNSSDSDRKPIAETGSSLVNPINCQSSPVISMLIDPIN